MNYSFKTTIVHETLWILPDIVLVQSLIPQHLVGYGSLPTRFRALRKILGS
jgi:hypothetical protein